MFWRRWKAPPNGAAGVAVRAVLPWLLQAVCKSPEAQNIFALSCIIKNTTIWKSDWEWSQLLSLSWSHSEQAQIFSLFEKDSYVNTLAFISVCIPGV